MTKKDPAVLWYTNDFLEGTADMSLKEIGAYTLLLCYQHQRGFLPDTPKKLSRLVRLTETDFDEIWEEIQLKFVSLASVLHPSSDEGSDTPKGAIINKRMYMESKKRANYLGKKAVFAIVGNWFRHHPLSKTLKKSEKEKIKRDISYPYIFENLLNKAEIENYITKIADRFAKGSDQGSLYLQQTLFLENENVIVNEDVNENENINNIKEPEISKFEKLVSQKFLKELSSFFAQNGNSRLQKVTAYLQKMYVTGELEEFVRQSEAYMAYKKASQERIHGWEGYTGCWRRTDWIAKLKQFHATSQPPKRKFFINR